MKKVHLDSIQENERKSPKGKFHSFHKEISRSLGREPEYFDLHQRHPFDLTMTRVPPGASRCPYHEHSAEWELYVVVSGHGTVREAGGEVEVVAGDAFLFKPGEPHELINRGREDFVYFVIADNPVSDTCYYPDSRKAVVWRDGGEIISRVEEVDYYDGEE
jgi:uncharacterized cupin superfamily protein